MVRKVLHFSVNEWDNLEWWQQQLYLEQLNCDPEFNDDAEEAREEYAANTGTEITSFDDLPPL